MNKIIVLAGTSGIFLFRLFEDKRGGTSSLLLAVGGRCTAKMLQFNAFGNKRNEQHIMGALVAQARLSAPAPEEISCGTSAVRGSRPSSTEAAAVTSYLVTRFAVLSMSYLGWPVQVLASVLSYLSSILMCRARQRLKQLVAGRPAKVARRLGEEMAVASKSNGRVNALTKFLVRLKNLPPVRGRASCIDFSYPEMENG